MAHANNARTVWWEYRAPIPVNPGSINWLDEVATDAARHEKALADTQELQADMVQLKNERDLAWDNAPINTYLTERAGKDYKIFPPLQSLSKEQYDNHCCIKNRKYNKNYEVSPQGGGRRPEPATCLSRSNENSSEFAKSLPFLEREDQTGNIRWDREFAKQRAGEILTPYIDPNLSDDIKNEFNKWADQISSCGDGGYVSVDDVCVGGGHKPDSRMSPALTSEDATKLFPTLDNVSEFFMNSTEKAAEAFKKNRKKIKRGGHNVVMFINATDMGGKEAAAFPDGLAFRMSNPGEGIQAIPDHPAVQRLFHIWKDKINPPEGEMRREVFLSPTMREIIEEHYVTKHNWLCGSGCGITPKVYFYGYVREQDEAGMWRLCLCIVTEKFDMSLHDWYDRRALQDLNYRKLIASLPVQQAAGEVLPGPYTLKEQDEKIADLIAAKLDESAYWCVVTCNDLKPQNVVIRFLDEHGNLLPIEDWEVRLIDYDGDFCNDASMWFYRVCGWHRSGAAGDCGPVHVAEAYHPKAVWYLSMILMTNTFIEHAGNNIFYGWWNKDLGGRKYHKTLVECLIRDIQELACGCRTSSQFRRMVNHYVGYATKGLMKHDDRDICISGLQILIKRCYQNWSGRSMRLWSTPATEEEREEASMILFPTTPRGFKSPSLSAASGDPSTSNPTKLYQELLDFIRDSSSEPDTSFDDQNSPASEAAANEAKESREILTKEMEEAKLKPIRGKPEEPEPDAIATVYAENALFLKKFYEKNNLEHLIPRIDSILSRYEGHFPTLVEKLEKKYNSSGEGGRSASMEAKVETLEHSSNLSDPQVVAAEIAISPQGVGILEGMWNWVVGKGGGRKRATRRRKVKKNTRRRLQRRKKSRKIKRRKTRR